jgi:hypothetical protein
MKTSDGFDGTTTFGNITILNAIVRINHSGNYTINSITSIDMINSTITTNKTFQHTNIKEFVPEVTLNITANNLTIDETSSIDPTQGGFIGAVDIGAGEGPGGGSLGSAGDPPGGAGHGGYGGSANDTTIQAGGTVYGLPLTPLEWGSGGGGANANFESSDGGNGGGALRIFLENELRLNGQLIVDGDDGDDAPAAEGGGGGSGGSILINVTTFSGTGSLNASGGAGGNNNNINIGGAGAGGLIAVHYNESTYTGKTNVNPGDSVQTIFPDKFAQPGSAIFIDKDESILTVKETFRLTKTEFFGKQFGDFNITNAVVTINSSENYTITVVGDTILKNGTINNIAGSTTNRTARANLVNLAINVFNFTLDENSSIDIFAGGYAGGSRSGASNPGEGPGAGQNSGGGAGYGGTGGNAQGESNAGPSYGRVTNPLFLGSGGGSTAFAAGGAGGGVLFFNLFENVNIEGTLIVAGQGGEDHSSGKGGGGSGGMIQMSASLANLSGNGIINLSGGRAGNTSTTSDGGGGGGGRIVIDAVQSSHETLNWTIDRTGGQAHDGGNPGEDGTLYNCKRLSVTKPCSGSGLVVLRTDFTINTSIVVNRTGIVFSNTTSVWNDSSSNPATKGIYNLTGMKPSTTYSVFDNRVFQEIITSDSNGRLPLFQVTLSSEHEINVSEGDFRANITSIILNATDHPQNRTNANLTLHLNITSFNTPVKNITTWFLNDTSIMLLNMPFEAGGSNSTFTRDYTPFGNNATVSGNTFNSTGGYDGFGAYSRDGTAGNTILVPNSSSLDSTTGNNAQVTISTWIKPATLIPTPLLDYIVRKGESANDATFSYDIEYRNDGGTVRIYVFYCKLSGNCGSNSDRFQVSSDTPISDTDWHHIVVTIDTTTTTASENVRIFIDGQESTHTTRGGSPQTGINLNSDIGIGIGSDTEGSAIFNGTIDDIIIFNKTLSAEQVLALYNNRTDLIVSQETNVGDTWKAQATPTDVGQDGITRESNNVTILTSTECGTLTQSTTLVNNVTSDDTCFTISASNIDLNCDGYGIFYNANGGNSEYGITSSIGVQNITIKDCYIRDINSTGTTSHGISLISHFNATITNNTVITNATGSGAGIKLNGGDQSIIENNTITTGNSGINNYGLWLRNSDYINTG